jgi:hypothetical protein
MGFVVNKAAPMQVFSDCFGFICQSFNRMPHILHPLFGAGTIGQFVADVPSGFSLTPPQETKNKMRSNYQKSRRASYVKTLAVNLPSI